MQYYGTRLSENISRREPEGYLLCLNVPVARTGTQEYLPEELGLPPGTAGVIRVYRPEGEVFSPAAIASFEGMPVTDGHPPEGVDVSNIRALQKGHAHNVRRGSGKEADLLLADLIITDPALITAVLEDGKREISCGYTYELCEENEQYIQRKIRGNHVAVVDAGRAGPRVSIKDHKPERSITAMKKSLSKVLARMAKDGDIETVAGIIEEMMETEETPETGEAEPAAAETSAEDPEVVVETPSGSVVAVDEEAIAGILERMDRIIGLLEPSAADEAAEITEAIEEALENAAQESGDPMAEEVSAAMEEILDPVASVILETEENAEQQEFPETLQTGDALRAVLNAVRPALVRMPRSVRSRVAADIAARLNRRQARGTTGSDALAALASARRRTIPASAELGRRIMEKRNVCYKKT